MEFEELRKMKKELEQTAIIEQEYGNITGKIENSIGTYLQFGKGKLQLIFILHSFHFYI